ncbi:ichor [Leptopilina heterotoma]|uniref:ichor n=1 Tax=Leptopilina heterotoma TaxID=63436 RepID=UPI001CA8509F|nr:ichor [Leptopilina heterotoma]
MFECNSILERKQFNQKEGVAKGRHPASTKNSLHDPKVEFSSLSVISPTINPLNEMKYETQSGPPTVPQHLTSSGIEPPHSSQTSGITVGGSPTEIVGVESLLLSPWSASGPDFIETSDVKQTASDLQDAWDTILLGSSVGVASAQTLAELKPLPPFTGYTGHLSINGIPGHHYHAIASSAQRPHLQSSSPSPTSNPEYYEAPVVSSSTPCPQVNQKQQSQHQQQQLSQSTQQVDYDIEDIAQIIGSAIADTTVPGGGNEPNSDHDPDASRDWIDIAEWIDTACSPKSHEQNSPSPYSHIYTTTASNNQVQQHGSTLQSLLTHGYAPLLQARLQAGNVGLQNTPCGEAPSSTSPYPPVSPPGRVSTSCSPDHLLHSSFTTPSHPRKRSRPNPGSQNPSKKSSGSTSLSYGTESGLLGGKEKPVHRCSICNRGFLNKSNIKVHLRTHTGEKPFRCEVCGKAFRQKAHLIKHQQIHKRIGRD